MQEWVTGRRIVPRFEELSADKLGYASCGMRKRGV